MKILELTNYSAGACGVWERAKQESLQFVEEGHEVKVFSSNITKGSNKIANSKDKIGKLEIKRFPAKKLGGESFMKWMGDEAEKLVLDYNPDIIIVHAYRHPHTTRALKIIKKINTKERKCKIFLVTHAPFIKNNSTRSLLGKLAVKFYDRFIGRNTINKFDRVISISKWENQYLRNLGLKPEKIEYIPNGLPEEFFKIKKSRKSKGVLFFGRISPIKNLEILIKAAKKLPSINFTIAGPAEENYFTKLKQLAGKQKNLDFSAKYYNLNEKIKLLDSHKILVLPSHREAMPQTILEAMARKKTVISSATQGGKEIITPNVNGFLFNLNDLENLTKLISENLNGNKKIEENAFKEAKNFRWKNLIKSYLRLF